MFTLLLLPLISFSTLLFYIPDDSSSTELRATIKFGIRQLGRGLWYDLDHEIINTYQHNIVKSLVSNINQDITAVLGVFTEEQLADITAILDAYNTPTFVLNQLSRTPMSPNIYQTRPSVEFELQGLEKLLEHYGWEQISYYVQANTSVVGMLQGKGRCWNKTVVETRQIREQTCRSFSVVVLVGCSRFQAQFIAHYTNLGCKNVIVVQYFLGSRRPVLYRFVQNNTEIGDLLMLFPKSFPVIETGSNPRDTAKYTCLHPSCLRYKIKQQYRQTEAVLLLLDSLSLLEIMLRQYGTITQNNIKDVSFKSAAGDEASLLDQGFSYNRMNVFKSGSGTGLDLLGWVDERGMELLSTTWLSTARDTPFSAPGVCSMNTSTIHNRVKTAMMNPYSTGLTKILSFFLISVMIVAVITLYVTQRNRNSLITTSFLFPFFLSCITISLSSCFLLEDMQYSTSTCIIFISRDMAEFVFYSFILYFILSYDTIKLPSVALTGALLFGKFLMLTWNFMEKSPTLFCVDADFKSSSNFMLSGLLSLNIVLVTVKHWGRLNHVIWVLLALLLSLAAEGCLYYTELPPSCVVALYTTRAVTTTAVIIFSRENKTVTGFEGVYVDDKDTLSCYESHPDHSMHCMETSLDDRRLLDHAVCQSCHDSATYDDFTCEVSQVSQVSCRYAESPQLFWDDEIEHCCQPHVLSPGPPGFPESSSPEPRSHDMTDISPDSRISYIFPERIKFERNPENQDHSIECNDETNEDAGSNMEKNETVETTEIKEDGVQAVIENIAPIVLYVGDEIRCYQNSYGLECYPTGGHLSEISEEDEEEEETQIRAIFRSDTITIRQDEVENDTIRHTHVSDSSSVEAGDSILDDIVLLKLKNDANNIKYHAN